MEKVEEFVLVNEVCDRKLSMHELYHLLDVKLTTLLEKIEKCVPNTVLPSDQGNAVIFYSGFNHAIKEIKDNLEKI